jgi:ABC-type transporter Mla subunit MlaD
MAIGRAIEVVAKLRDSISPTLTKVSTKVRTFGTKVGSVFGTIKSAVFGLKGALVGVGLILVGGALKRGLDSLVQSSTGFQDAVVALEAAIKSMGRTTPNLSRELVGLADKIQDVTGVGNSAIIQGQGFLATYKDIADHLMPRVTKVMVDFATKTGQGVVPAANAMGKASMGLTGELSRMGITLSDTAKETKDFELILSEIEEQVGGLSDALGSTFRGNVNKLTSSIDDLKRAFGDMITESPFLIRMLEGMTSLVVDFTKRANELTNEDVEDWFERTAQSISNALGKLFEWGVAFAGFINDIGLGLEKVLDSLGKLFDALADAPFMSEELSTWFSETAESLRKGGDDVRVFFGNLSIGAHKALVPLNALKTKLDEVLGGDWEKMYPDLAKLIEDAGKRLSGDAEAGGIHTDPMFTGWMNQGQKLGDGKTWKQKMEEFYGEGTYGTSKKTSGFVETLSESTESAGKQAALMFSTAFGDSLAQLMLDGDGASTMEVIGAGIGNILGAEVTESLQESMGGIGAGIMGGLVGGLIGRIFRKKKPAKIDKPIPVKVVNWGDMTGQLLKAGARRNVSPMITTGGNIMMSSNFGREARI